MPSIPMSPDSIVAPSRKRRTKSERPERVTVNGHNDLEPIRTTTRVIDGRMYTVKVLPTQDAAPRAESKMIWGDGPRRRGIL